MKTKIATIATLISCFAFATAAEKIKSPNGGRIITKVEPHAEFLVTKDKKIEIRFLDAAGKVIAPQGQTVSIVMGDRAAPTKISFTQDGDKLIADKGVPDGVNLPVVLQIKSSPEAKAVITKFNLDLSICPTCSKAEYGCSCDHHSEENPTGHEGHDHKPGESHDH